MKAVLILIAAFICSVLSANAEVIPDYFDIHGNPMHSADEFDLIVSVSVQSTAQGYQYNYTLTSQPSSIQKVAGFSIGLSSDAVVPNTSSSPWPTSREPQPGDALPVMGWATLFDALNTTLLVPGGQMSGFSFVSPYPPGIVQAYAEGVTEYPRFNDAYPDGHPLYDGRTPYGPGKVFPVIGPVKPAGAVAGTPASNVTVQRCEESTCAVQMNVIGPMDPSGSAYSYVWTGPFGKVSGAKPVVEMPIGTTPVMLHVSDSNGTLLATATINVVVVNPNPVSKRDEDGSSNDAHDGEDHGSDHHNEAR